MAEIQFEAIVRDNKTIFPDHYGRIVSKSLGKLIGKKVLVTVKVVEKA